MSKINKQKFLTELEKMLTFMHQEDRITAIAMYSKMFDLAGDDAALITALVSPTRQAVQMARSYDANERKMTIEAHQSGDEEYYPEEETAPFILRIKEIFEAALDSMPQEETAQEESSFAEKQTEDAMHSLEEISQAKSKTDEAEAVTDAEIVVETETKESPVMEITDVDESNINHDVDYFANQIDEFLKDFKIENSEIIGDYSNEQKPSEAESAAENVKETAEVNIEKTIDSEPKQESEDTEATEKSKKIKNDDFDDEDDVTEVKPKKKEKKPERRTKKETAENSGNVKLGGKSLALFLLIAIPLTAIALILLFALAIAVLAVTAAGFLMSVRILSAAFASFRVFADVLVVTGTGFVLSAISFLLLWTAIWLAFGASAKVVNAIINLATKICTKGD